MISSTPLKKNSEKVLLFITWKRIREWKYSCYHFKLPFNWKILSLSIKKYTRRLEKKALLISIEKYPRQLQNTHVIWKIILCSIENTHNIWKRNKHWHLVKKTPLVSRKLLLASEIEKIDRQMPAHHMIWPAAGV